MAGAPIEAEGRFVKQTGGRGWYARVRVCYRDEPPANSEEPRAELAAGLKEQGTWYAGWLEAALFGAAIGLELAGVPGRCVVTELDDRMMPSATNPKAIALAAVRAVWAAVSFAPDEAKTRRVEACVAGLVGLHRPAGV
jgi:hypothetical protein